MFMFNSIKSYTETYVKMFNGGVFGPDIGTGDHDCGYF